MRLSVDTGDPGYAPDAHGVEVYFDGVKLKGCITADEEKGIALVHVHDEYGKPVLTSDRKGVETRWLKGKVEIRLKR